jgi:hypothetical protein
MDVADAVEAIGLSTPTTPTAQEEEGDEEGVMTRSGLRRRRTATPKKAKPADAETVASRRHWSGSRY